MTLLDLICPIYHVDWDVFTYCVDSWIKNLPINRILISLANPDQKERETVRKYLEQKYPRVVFYKHSQYSTLGKCLSCLIEDVNTEFFIYVHSDVEITNHCFHLIKAQINDKTGIIESERLHSDKIKVTYDPYHFSPRAYSGFQVMRKEAVAIQIDDDFVYRNEDMIYQNICEQRGYEYVKSWAMHIHYLTTTKKWTHEREETYDMQWKGLVKYTTPTDITIQATLDALHVCLHEFDHDILTILEEMDELNPSKEWKRCILKRLIR